MNAAKIPNAEQAAMLPHSGRLGFIFKRNTKHNTPTESPTTNISLSTFILPPFNENLNKLQSVMNLERSYHRGGLVLQDSLKRQVNLVSRKVYSGMNIFQELLSADSCQVSNPK
jgi:hypothetical protein